MPTVTRTLPLSPLRAWDLVADARNHARWIPLTRVDVVDGEVVAVTGPRARRGGGGLVDRMRIDRFDPPGDRPGDTGVAVFVKVGRVLRGTARIEVGPVGQGVGRTRAGRAPRQGVGAPGASARVAWSEDVHLAGPLPRRLTSTLAAPVLAGMMWLALWQADREARRDAPHHL